MNKKIKYLISLFVLSLFFIPLAYSYAYFSVPSLQSENQVTKMKLKSDDSTSSDLILEDNQEDKTLIDNIKVEEDDSSGNLQLNNDDSDNNNGDDNSDNTSDDNDSILDIQVEENNNNLLDAQLDSKNSNSNKADKKSINILDTGIKDKGNNVQADLKLEPKKEETKQENIKKELKNDSKLRGKSLEDKTTNVDTKTQTKEEKVNKKKPFKAIFNTSQVFKELSQIKINETEIKNEKATSSKEEKEILSKVENKYGVKEENIAQFKKSYNSILSNQNIGEAIKKAELEKCRAYYSNDLQHKITQIFNALNLYADRSDKVMIAFNLWKQDTPVPEEVDSAMDILHDRLYKNLNRGLYYLSSAQKESSFDAPKFNSCYSIRLEYNKIFGHYGPMKEAFREIAPESTRLENMKEIIKEFTKEKPFDNEFMFYLQCYFDKDYFDNLTWENWPKDNNGKSFKKEDCETSANPFMFW